MDEAPPTRPLRAVPTRPTPPSGAPASGVGGNPEIIPRLGHLLERRRSPTMKSDEDLFRAGDRDSLQELFERHKEDVYRTTRRILRNDADALDATQAAFLNALQALPTLKEAAKFPGWLRRIAVNAALGMKRTRGSERGLAGSSPPAEAAPAMSAEDFLVLKRAVNDLPEEYRLPIVLHHGEGLTYEAIARI